MKVSMLAILGVFAATSALEAKPLSAPRCLATMCSWGDNLPFAVERTKGRCELMNADVGKKPGEDCNCRSKKSERFAGPHPGKVICTLLR